MPANACTCRYTTVEPAAAPDLPENAFTIRLDAGQRLPEHRHPARIVITAVRGEGVITVGTDDRRALGEGMSVQLEPNAVHGVVAGADGLELFIATVANCCEAC